MERAARGNCPPRVFALAGQTLMTLTLTADGVIVRCPGCCAEHTFAAGGPESPRFSHADRGCPVERAIAAAFAAFEALDPERQIGARPS